MSHLIQMKTSKKDLIGCNLKIFIFLLKLQGEKKNNHHPPTQTNPQTSKQKKISPPPKKKSKQS